MVALLIILLIHIDLKLITSTCETTDQEFLIPRIKYKHPSL